MTSFRPFNTFNSRGTNCVIPLLEKYEKIVCTGRKCPRIFQKLLQQGSMSELDSIMVRIEWQERLHYKHIEING